MNSEAEKEHLSQVLALLDEAVKKSDDSLSQSEQDIAKMQDYYWENYNEFDEFGYEDYDNRQNYLAAVNMKSEQIRSRYILKKMQDSPYFGRVDFVYEDEDAEDTYYIGIGNFSPDYRKQPVILDWRAPVSGLFYDFDKGPAYFDAPGGRMEGDITRKKQYQIKQGTLLYEFESDIKIDDDILMRELSQNADTRLKSIVTTIQREQNQIIRNKKSRILVVQGSAGSGKTSIALHRVAYLLYHNRETLKADNILILSPNSIFSDYISRILPELGEENMKEMSFDEFCAKELSDYGETEDRYDYIERVLSEGETEEMRAKLTKSFAEELNGYALELESGIICFKDFRFKKVEMSADELAEFFYVKFPDIPLLKRMETIGEYIIGQEEAVRGKDMEDEEKVAVYDKLNGMYRTRDVRKLYRSFLTENGFSVNGEYNVPDRQEKTEEGAAACPVPVPMIRYEDAAPLLYLKYLLEGSGRHRRMKHVLIDEMQDYSYLQFSLIKQIFKCPMTILGDREQTLTEKREDVLSFLSDIFGKEIQKAILKKSYRSSYEIAAFAAGLIGQTDIQFYPRHGKPPEWIQVTDAKELAERIAERILSEKEFDTCGILCKNREQADFVYSILRDRMPVTLLHKDSDRFVKGAVVTTYYLAKGLEFDTVHVPFALRPETADELERQILYLCATRALHRLSLYEAESNPMHL